MRPFSVSLFFLFIMTSIAAQNTANPLLSKDVLSQKKWVDSVYASMSLAEKVGQLYMVQVMSNQDTVAKNKIIKQPKK